LVILLLGLLGLLVVINGYFIGGYLCPLVVILLMVIGGYSINGQSSYSIGGY
jgi:hypothetical protein